MFKYLQIAVTVLSLTACVLLIALWARSYWWMDIAQWSASDELGFQATSTDGRVWLITQELHGHIYWPTWKVLTMRAKWQTPPSTWGFRLNRYKSGTLVETPHWFFVLVSAVMTAAVGYRIPKHFSLRTLLFAMTLVAVVLAVIAALV